MQVIYLHKQSAKRPKSGDGRQAEGVAMHVLPDGGGLGVEPRLFILDPDGVLASSQGEGERHFFVLGGAGEVSAARSETTQPLQKGALLTLNPDEGFRIRNIGNDRLSLLYFRPTAAALTPTPPQEGGGGEDRTQDERESDTAPVMLQAEVTPVAPTSAASGRRGKGQASQVREEPPPYATPQPSAAVTPEVAPVLANPNLPTDDDDSDSSRTFRLVFDGGSDETHGFGSYRLYPPVMGGQRPPTINEQVEFEQMPAAQAAYQTLIHALEDLTARLQEDDEEPANWQVDVSGSNRLVITQVQGEKPPRSGKAIELLSEVQTLLAQFGGYTVSFQQE